MTGKILAEMDPSSMDTATVNKLKHLNRLANYGMKTPMKSILNFNAVMFRAVENQALTWQNWDKIDQFYQAPVKPHSGCCNIRSRKGYFWLALL